MKYPYRIKVLFRDDCQSKLQVILETNRFLSHTQSKWEKWNINISTKEERYGMDISNLKYAGVEIGFENRIDAIHFKLGFSNEGAYTESDDYSRKEDV